MSIDKNNPASTTDDQTDGQIESLESDEIKDIELEMVSGGASYPDPATHPSIMIDLDRDTIQTRSDLEVLP